MITPADRTKHSNPNDMAAERTEQILQRIADGFRQLLSNALSASAAVMRTSNLCNEYGRGAAKASLQP